jgi:hypothetical protein
MKNNKNKQSTRRASVDPTVDRIGELCHVLGITCRTQWMNTGFSFSASQSPQTDKKIDLSLVEGIHHGNDPNVNVHLLALLDHS